MVFMQAVRDYTGAQAVLDDIIDSAVRDVVNKNDLVEIIRSSDWDVSLVGAKGKSHTEEVQLGRDKMAGLIFKKASLITPKYGIELVDVMFKRVNYIDTVRSKVYQRMISERNRIAAEKRSMGEGQKSEILGKLERELKDITSGAKRESEEIKGRADAAAAKIYAEAYSKDPEFYAFSKSLQSYVKTVDDNTKLLISSDSEFYKYFDKQ
jgi:membrane protease subunit HflC